MSVRGYRDLDVWKNGIELIEVIYEVSGYFPDVEKYGLSNQIRRAAVSIPSNIAEGQGRGTANEFKRYIQIAIGSLAEVDTQLEISHQLGYLETELFTALQADILQLRKMLYGLKRSL